MKKILPIVIIALLILQSGNRSALYFSYLANKDFIKANFCENINKPKLSCDGKCHLKKQLDKETERESNSLIDVNSKVEYISEQNSIILHFLPIASIIKSEHNTKTSDSGYTTPCIDFYLPPKI